MFFPLAVDKGLQEVFRNQPRRGTYGCFLEMPQRSEVGYPLTTTGAFASVNKILGHQLAGLASLIFEQKKCLELWDITT